MPQGFFYQASARPDVTDDDTDVFFDTVNSVPQENRHDYHVLPTSAIAGTIDTQYGSDDNCFSQDVDQLPQQNAPIEFWEPFSFIQSEVGEGFDTDVFTDPWNAVPQENRREYERFPGSFIDGNADFGETDVFSDPFQLAQQNAPIEFWTPGSFIQSEDSDAGPIDSDSFAITYERSNLNDRQEYFVWPFGSLDGGVSDATEISDSDTFSDTCQLDSSCRVDVFMWPATWIDGNADFAETDVFTDTSQIPAGNRIDVPAWPHVFGEQATVEVIVSTDSFSLTFDLPQENRHDEFMRDVSYAGPNAFEDDASYDVYASTFNPLPQENIKPYEQWYFSETVDAFVIDSDVFAITHELPQQNRRDDQEWPAGTVTDMTTDDPSFYVFADLFQLPQENIRPQHEFPVESSGPNTSEDDASYTVYFDTSNSRPVETLKPYEQWPTSAAGDSSIDDPSWYVFHDIWNDQPQENRKDYHAWTFVFATDPTSDDPEAMIFTRMVDQLDVTVRRDEHLWPTSAQGDASETDPSAFVFSSTFDIAQDNRRDEFMVRFSAEADSSEDNTGFIAFADTSLLPQTNRHDEFAWPVASAGGTETDDTSGDSYFCGTVFALPQENRVDVFAWPLSAQGDASGEDAPPTFFDTFQLPQETIKRYDEFSFSFLVDNVVTAIVIGAYAEVVDSFVPGAQAVDCYTSLIVAQDWWVDQ